MSNDRNNRSYEVDLSEGLNRSRFYLDVCDYIAANMYLAHLCEVITNRFGSEADILGDLYLLRARALIGLSRNEFKQIMLGSQTGTYVSDPYSNLQLALELMERGKSILSKRSKPVPELLNDISGLVQVPLDSKHGTLTLFVDTLGDCIKLLRYMETKDVTYASLPV